jgi:hypothetical protein
MEETMTPTPHAPRRLPLLALALSVVIALWAGVAGAQTPEGGAPPVAHGGVGPEESVFVPVYPCRLVNTQNSAGPLAANEERTYRMHGNTSAQGGAADCGIPQEATALELSITSVSAAGDGYLRTGSVQQSLPTATFLNYSELMNVTNTGAVKVSSNETSSFRIKVFVASTHVVVDVYGYYIAA